MNTFAETLPRALAILYTLNDVAGGRVITRRAAIEAYRLLLSAASVELDYTQRFTGKMVCGREMDVVGPCGELIGQLGEEGTCYATALICAEGFGGSVVYGWRVVVDEASPMSNRFGQYTMGAHAVWKRPDGVLTEVAPTGRNVVGFYPHARVKLWCQATVNFLDRYGAGEMVESDRGEKLLRMDVYLPSAASCMNYVNIVTAEACCPESRREKQDGLGFERHITKVLNGTGSS